MTNWIIAGIVLVMTLLDAGLSIKRLKELGLDAELNPLVRATCKHLGLWSGMAVSLVVPWMFTLGFSILFDWKLFLGFMLGIRTLWCFFQLESLKKS